MKNDLSFVGWVWSHVRGHIQIDIRHLAIGSRNADKLRHGSLLCLIGGYDASSIKI
jgi:hypothetical protein